MKFGEEGGGRGGGGGVRAQDACTFPVVLG